MNPRVVYIFHLYISSVLMSVGGTAIYYPLLHLFFFLSFFVSVADVLVTVVLPVAAIWTVGLFLVILIIVAKAGSRRLAQLDKPQFKGSGQL